VSLSHLIIGSWKFLGVSVWWGSLVKVLLVSWLVAGSEEDWWQSVVGSLIQVLLPWSVTESGASVDMTWLEVLLSRCYWLADWLLGIGGSQWWAL
jgi:hypothetical protein